MMMIQSVLNACETQEVFFDYSQKEKERKMYCSVHKSVKLSKEHHGE
jgi:hypothetical protein